MTGKRILLVDDDDSQREVVEEILALEGTEVLSVPGSERAAAVVERSDPPPDAALVDLNGVNVDAVFNALRQRAGRCAIVLVSGDIRLPEHAARLGADGSLGKPYEIDDLFRVIAEAMARRRGEQPGASV